MCLCVCEWEGFTANQMAFMFGNMFLFRRGSKACAKQNKNCNKKHKMAMNDTINNRGVCY